MISTANPPTSFTTTPSPVGDLTLVAGPRALEAILWAPDRPSRVRKPASDRDDDHPILRETCRQLDEYFAGERTAFDLPLEFHGTDFQKSVWNQLLLVPFGTTCTYGEIAGRLGNADAMRAVGAANGRNPIPIVAPCHRVIGASGNLTGFGGGLATKAFLLDLERADMSFDGLLGRSNVASRMPSERDRG